MAWAFGVSTSRSAVLRSLDALPEPEVPAPRVVGVDEYATRKGRVCGAVLVDVDTRRPVDLPDQEPFQPGRIAGEATRDRGRLPDAPRSSRKAPQPGHPR
jgi:hypothetical protein